MLTLFTDTDTDITPEIAKEYGYHVISMPYSIDGNTVYPFENSDTFDYKAFYDGLREGVLPNTSAISEERYIHYFEPIFAAGNDVLYVHFSRAMTATFDNMDKAVEKLLAKYPDRKFYPIDTKGITTISLGIVMEVGDMVKAGKTPEEIVAWSKEEVDHFAMWFFTDDLKFFRHSGRVSGLKATMGTLLGVRPIIHMSEQGKMENVGSEKGRFKAMTALADRVAEDGLDVKNHRVLIGHTDALDIAEQVGEMLKERLGDDLDIRYCIVNPTAGSHCGPNGVGVCFHAAHR